MYLRLERFEEAVASAKSRITRKGKCCRDEIIPR